ncbi:MAG: biotin--[Clostridia bacterium]|nr:biotin--[acetyl-CoA-carboxylase] ligase [Clostridia bacterium]
MKAEIIEKGLNYNGKVVLLDETPSTNTYVLSNKTDAGDIVVAVTQTKGKGRAGKQWVSNTNSIAMSISLDPKIPPSKLPAVPLIFGVAVCSVIREISQIDAMIKWPNDIVYNGKKLCGILCEAKTEDGNVVSVVCGAGINVNDTEFSKEIESIATSLKKETGKTFDRNEIIYKIANAFNSLVSIGYTIPDSFSELCVNIGRDVVAIANSKKVNGRCKGVDENGALIITTDGGEITVNSGEVSVRGFYGYY